MALLTPKTLAEACGVPVSWVYANVRLGRLPYFKIGHYVRFNPAEIEVWLRQQRRGLGHSGLATAVAGSENDERG